MVDLSGLWEFGFVNGVHEPGVDLQAVDLASVNYHDRMLVPHAFDAAPAYAGRRGTAFYRTHFEQPAGRAARLHFEAVSMWCRVYVDGQPLREHASGWSPFWVDVPPADHARRDLVVVVDNRFSFERVPLHEEYQDFYHWGGILRPCWLHDTGAAWIDHVQVLVDDWKSGQVTLQVRLGGEQVPDEVELSVAWDAGEEEIWTGNQVVERTVRLSLEVPNARAWSPASPSLHTVRIGYAGDDMQVRFGLREINIDGPRLMLNDEPIKLLGYNRHESHPQFGPAVPVQVMLQDLQLMRSGGCNFIRGSHYPQDQRFLDLCDELGFLVWEESLGWGQFERQLTDERFLSHHYAQLPEMVEASCNHPCIILWGFLNELHSDKPFGRPVVEKSVDLLRSLDPTRLITYATCRPDGDLCLDLVDIIALNLYPGWYGANGVPDGVRLIVPKIRALVAKFDAEHPGKPIMISEIGAEALYGWRDAMNGFFTEEFQSRYDVEVAREVAGSERLVGLSIWHWADARTYQTSFALGKPRAYNNKGVLDEYRRPKAAYHAVSEVYRSVCTPRPVGG